MKYPGLTLEQVETIVDRIGGMEGVEMFLKRETFIAKASIAALLKLQESIAFPGTKEKFIVNDAFAYRNKGSVNIMSVSDRFEISFKGLEEKPSPAVNLYCYEVIRPTNDEEVISKLGGELLVETRVAHIWSILNDRNEDLKNRNSHYFYVRDLEGNLARVGFWGNRSRCEVNSTPIGDYYRIEAGSNIYVSRPIPKDLEKAIPQPDIL